MHSFKRQQVFKVTVLCDKFHNIQRYPTKKKPDIYRKRVCLEEQIYLNVAPKHWTFERIE